jgi:hypothetical protein
VLLECPLIFLSGLSHLSIVEDSLKIVYNIAGSLLELVIDAANNN